MKVLISLLLLFSAVAFVITVNAQSKTVSDISSENSKLNKSYQCDISYNKFDDYISIRTTPSLIKGRGGNMYISISATIKGNTLKESPDHYIVDIYTPHNLTNHQIKYFFENKIKDNTPLSSTPTITKITGSRMYAYFYLFTLDDLNKFANPSDNEIQIGGYQGITTKEISDKIKAIIKLTTLK